MTKTVGWALGGGVALVAAGLLSVAALTFDGWSPPSVPGPREPPVGVPAPTTRQTLPEAGQLEFVVEGGAARELELTYRVPGTAVAKATLEVRVDGVLPSADWRAVTLDQPWQDYGPRSFDRYHIETTSAQAPVATWLRARLEEASRLSGVPLRLDLAPGPHRVTLLNRGAPVEIGGLRSVPVVVPPTAPSAERVGSNPAGLNPLAVIEAENYAWRSDSVVRAAAEPGLAAYPNAADRRLLNTLDESSWALPGQTVAWDVEVAADGWYQLGLRSKRSAKENAASYRDLLIDGAVPSADAVAVPFEWTQGRWTTGLFGPAGKPVTFWLTKGRHELVLRADAGPSAAAVRSVRSVMDALSDFGLEARKAIGNSSDADRTWDVDRYLPGAATRLKGWAARLESIYQSLGSGHGNPTFAENLRIAASRLREAADKPRQIPSRLPSISEGDSSALRLLADTLQQLSSQPLGLDRLYLVTPGTPLPDLSPSPVATLLVDLRSFLRSFVPGESAYFGRSGANAALQVWVNLPLQYVQIVQQMADSRFTPATGIAVDLSVLQGDQKLLLANSTREAPDAATGIATGLPYAYGIRGAVADLASFPGFQTFVQQNFAAQSIVPYTLGSKVWGLTEAQDFYVLFWRKDIFANLGLTPPQTWDDVKDLLPVLERRSMDFYVPLAGWNGYKPFYTTLPFVWQENGRVYQPDGASTAFSTEASLKGIRLMTDLFRLYSMPLQVPSFYNDFRYGRIPVGVANFSTYVWLKSAAPELAGLWDIAPSPGVRQADGSIVRSQIAADRADVILEGSKRKDDAWKYLQWWLSAETQTDFAFALESRFGPEYLWNSSNLKAFANLPMEAAHKAVVLEQWKQIRELPPHPAAYMVERSLSDLWNSVVVEGRTSRLAADRANVEADREIVRKLEEFGYAQNGELTRPYPVPETSLAGGAP